MSLDRGILIGSKPEPAKTVEVCRSFSRKYQLETYLGPKFKYESVDLFASRKMHCSLEDSKWVGDQLFEECVAEVRESFDRMIAEHRRKQAQRSEVA